MPLWSFIRHGESTANAEGWIAGVTDAPLTPRGLEQAERARPRIASVPFVRAFCSDLARALDTARILLRGRDVALGTTSRLRERSCGTLEGRPFGDLHGLDETIRSWDWRPPGGESLGDVASRALGWLATVDAEKDTLIIAHGALIRTVIGVVDRTPRSLVGQWKPANCELVSRELAMGSWARLLAGIGSR